MKIFEIESRDITAYKLTTSSDKEVTGNLSKDYKAIICEYLLASEEYKKLNRKSTRDISIMQSILGRLMNKIVHIDNLCIDILNTEMDADADADAIHEKLNSIYSDIESMYNTL